MPSSIFFKCETNPYFTITNKTEWHSVTLYQNEHKSFPFISGSQCRYSALCHTGEVFYLYTLRSSPGTAITVMSTLWETTGTWRSSRGVRTATAPPFCLQSLQISTGSSCCQSKENASNRKYRLLPAGRACQTRNWPHCLVQYFNTFCRRDGSSRTQRKIRWNVENGVWGKYS